MTPGNTYYGIGRVDHVVVIAMENRNYDDVAGLPYIGALIRAGSVFTNPMR